MRQRHGKVIIITLPYYVTDQLIRPIFLYSANYYFIKKFREKGHVGSLGKKACSEFREKRHVESLGKKRHVTQ